MSEKQNANKEILRKWLRSGVPTATLYVNTKLETFCSWLESHIASVAIDTFLLTEAILCDVSNDGNVRTYSIDGNIRHSIKDSELVELARQLATEAGHTTFEKDDTVAEPISNIIRFQISRLGAERTEIVAGCRLARIEVLGYFYSLLEGIAEAWPEASDSVLKYAAEVGVHEDQLKGYTAYPVNVPPIGDLSLRQIAADDINHEPTPAKKNKGKKRGRQPLTDEEWQERIETVEKILQTQKSLGINLEQACAREGVPYSTFRDWRRKLTSK